MTVTELLVLSLAVFRLARLVTSDTISQPARTWILERFPADDSIFLEPGDNRMWVPELDGWMAVRSHWLGQLVSCVWCSGFWVAVVVSVVWWASPEVVFWVLLPFALSAAAGIIEEVT